MKDRQQAPRSARQCLFLLHTFARSKGPAAGAVPWALPGPQASSFFSATFCNNSTSGTPDLPGCLPDLGAHLLLGPLKSLNRQQENSFFSSDFLGLSAIREVCFLFGFSLRFCIRAAVLFLCDFSRLFQITGPLLYLLHKRRNVSDLVEPAALALICPPASRLYMRES